jgi:hypothetical protein
MLLSACFAGLQTRHRAQAGLTAREESGEGCRLQHILLERATCISVDNSHRDLHPAVLFLKWRPPITQP